MPLEACQITNAGVEDSVVHGGSIQRGWEIFGTKVPLTAAELQQIGNNRTGFTTLGSG